MIILSIDPGTATTGFAVIHKRGDTLRAIEYGVIRTKPDHSAPERLRQIHEEVGRLMDEHSPDVLVTERLFFGKNETTAISVGRSIGVILLAAGVRGMEWVEYSPPQVKQAVVGYGSADKKQVQYMVQRLLGLKEVPKPDDAADALAVGICHANSILPVSAR